MVSITAFSLKLNYTWHVIKTQRYFDEKLLKLKAILKFDSPNRQTNFKKDIVLKHNYENQKKKMLEAKE